LELQTIHFLQLAEEEEYRLAEEVAVVAEMHRVLMYRQTLVVLEIRVPLSIDLCLAVVEGNIARN
jgi:hypothetical protein